MSYISHVGLSCRVLSYLSLSYPLYKSNYLSIIHLSIHLCISQSCLAPSYPILPYLTRPYPISSYLTQNNPILSSPLLFYLIPCYPVLSCLILHVPILTYLILCAYLSIYQPTQLSCLSYRSYLSHRICKSYRSYLSYHIYLIDITYLVLSYHMLSCLTLS